MIPLAHQANAFYTSSSSPYHHLFRQQTVPKVYTIRSFHDWTILTYIMCTCKATQYDHAVRDVALSPGPLRGRRKALIHTVCACANVSVKIS